LRIVVDTNIVFSAILNTDSNVSKLLINKVNKFDFYSCDFLKSEIDQNKSKILKITGFSRKEFLEVEYLVTKNITFINHRLAGSKNISKAEALLMNIDIKDAPFYILSKYLKAKLWTGDKILLKGLERIGYKEFITTQELLKISQ
jgi:predicted nucleic acid-binding protein